jgi:Skp family chaperone for outer membrane proteins
VRTSLVCAAVVAMLIASGWLAGPAHGQTATGTMVVVIDIPLIFKNHERFKAQIEDIKKDIDKYKDFVTAEQRKIRAEAEKLEQYKPGTQEYKQIEEAVARMNMDLQLKSAKQQKDFMEQEAKAYYNTYREIEKSVEDFAARNGIQLVLRYSSEDMDATKRESIMQGINRIVVYQSRLDITQMVLERVNRGTQQQATRPASPTAPQIPPRR